MKGTAMSTRYIALRADEAEQAMVELNKKDRGIKRDADYLRVLIKEDNEKILKKNVSIESKRKQTAAR